LSVYQLLKTLTEDGAKRKAADKSATGSTRVSEPSKENTAKFPYLLEQQFSVLVTRNDLGV
jgi:hypothetical protein